MGLYNEVVVEVLGDTVFQTKDLFINGMMKTYLIDRAGKLLEVMDDGPPEPTSYTGGFHFYDYAGIEYNVPENYKAVVIDGQVLRIDMWYEVRESWEPRVLFSDWSMLSQATIVEG